MRVFKSCVRLLGIFSSLLLLMHCASYSSFQTANTVEKGQIAGSGGIGKNHLADELYGDVSVRVGAGDSLDIGARFNYTVFGSSVLTIDGKRQLYTKVDNVKAAVGFSVAQVFADDLGVAFQVPFYLSIASHQEHLTFYVSPRAIYYLDCRQSAEYNNSTFGAGQTMGIKIGNRFSLMPEWGVLYGRHDDAWKLNNFFSVGIGLNIP